MDQKILWAVNKMPKTDDKNLPIMGLEEIKKARTFHESFPQYSETPLTKLPNMASYLGVKEVYVKDESYRFGLNAFKVLGGSFAMARYIAKETGKDVSELPYSVLTSEQLRKEFGQATFFTATDGNHGRGVAWAANRLGQKAVVHMPKGTTQTRLQNIAKEGAQVDIQELNYDDCVRLAAKEADKTPRGVIVQDTAWDGYEEIPAWIMQGYGTMAMEAGEQLKAEGCERPTHIFVQAGVGSLAGAVVGYFSNLYASVPWYMDFFIKICEFSLGVFMGINLESVKRHPWLIMSAGLALLPVHPAFINTAIVAALFLTGLQTEALLSRLPASLSAAVTHTASISYFIYLVHHIIIYAFGDLLSGKILLSSGAVCVLFLVELSIMTASAMLLRRISGWISGKISGN